jgi:hypothetical protein
MKLKLDEQGKPVMQDGHPVYVHDDGKEAPFDAKATVATIARLNGEAKSHRERAEAAELALKPFKDAGLTDAGAAVKAIELVKNLDDKKLVDAGKVEEIKNAAIAATEAKYKPLEEQVRTLETQLYEEKIGGAFARSPLITGDKAKVAIPADLVQARFGKHFAIKDGKVVATDAHGNQIFSRSRPGEPADFDEALDVLIDSYPQKDSILKGANQSGNGTQQQQGKGQQGKTMTRASWEALDPTARAAEVKAGTIIT